MDSAAFAAYELIALASTGTTIISCAAGYAWGSHTRKMRELASEAEEIKPLFPQSAEDWDVDLINSYYKRNYQECLDEQEQAL